MEKETKDRAERKKDERRATGRERGGEEERMREREVIGMKNHNQLSYKINTANNL